MDNSEFKNKRDLMAEMREVKASATQYLHQKAHPESAIQPAPLT